MILVALEFGVMMISSALTATRFALSVTETFIIERRDEEVMTIVWEEKSRRMANLNLATGKPTLRVFDSRLYKIGLLKAVIAC